MNMDVAPILTLVLTLAAYTTVVCFFFYRLNEKTISEWRKEHSKQMTEWREECKEWREEHREDIKIMKDDIKIIDAKWEKLFNLFVELKLKQEK